MLSQPNFIRRSIREQQTAISLAQFANANPDLDLGGDRVENLVGALIVSSPAMLRLVSCRSMTSTYPLSEMHKSTDTFLLQAEAPEQVIDDIAAGEGQNVTHTNGIKASPSPPNSQQQNKSLSPEQRKELEMLQELIKRKLQGAQS